MGSNINSWKIFWSPTSGKIYYLIYSDLPLLEICGNSVQVSLQYIANHLWVFVGHEDRTALG
jgi:hypothetical protein